MKMQVIPFSLLMMIVRMHSCIFAFPIEHAQLGRDSFIVRSVAAWTDGDVDQALEARSHLRLWPLDEHNAALLNEVHPRGYSQSNEPYELYDLLVIGAGAGGLVSSKQAARRGAKSCMITEHLAGGDCLNVGCVPSKALLRASRAVREVRRAAEFGVVLPEGEIRVDFGAIMRRMRMLRSKIAPADGHAGTTGTGAHVFQGRGRFTGPDTVEVNGQTLRFKNAVIATGGRPSIPDIPGLAQAPYTTNEILFNLDVAPPRMVILGAGVIAMEMAQCFASFGSKVTVVQRSDRLFASTYGDQEAAQILQKTLEEDGVTFISGNVKQVTTLRERLEQQEQLPLMKVEVLQAQVVVEMQCECLLVATGRVANVEHLGLEAAGVEFQPGKGVLVNDLAQSTNPNIYAVGDCVAGVPRLTHMSGEMAKLVVQNALFNDTWKLSSLVVPAVAYTEPEYATVGIISEDMAAAQGIQVDVYRAGLEHNDRAILESCNVGFCKIFCQQGTDIIVGSTIVAPRAGEMINEVSLAIKSSVGLRAVGRNIHAYPTFGEAVMGCGIQHINSSYLLGTITYTSHIMDSSVESAIKAAKYNEAVVVSLSSTDDSSINTQEIVLVARLDAVNGGVTWNQVQASDNDNDHDVGIVQHLRTKRWVLPMLNDHCRNNLYNEAIREASKEAVKKLKERDAESSSKPTVHALDIGSGTGLLAMMAARHLQTEAQLVSEIDTTSEVNLPVITVTSLEMSSAMARLARQTIASNDLEQIIDVLEAHSFDVTLEQKVHLCTSELLDSGLLGEGVIPALRDAWERHLHADAVVVPQRARIFAQVLEGRECVGNYWGPHACGTAETLRLCLSADSEDVMIGGAHGEIIVPLHCAKLFAPNGKENLNDESFYARSLCEPIEVLSFSFLSDGLPDASGRCQTTSFIPSKSGVAHGVLFWWELDLWDGLVYSTESGKQPWQDHWQQCLYVFPTPDSECSKLKEGELKSLEVRHDDSRISFEIMADDNQHNMPLKRHRAEALPAAISPQRAFQLNDKNRISLLRTAMAFAVAEKGIDTSVVDLSDFALCAMLAALEGALNVTSVESSTGTLAQSSARVAQLANGLPRSGASFQILQCHPEQLTIDAIPGLSDKPVGIVVAEPYFEVLEGWHLQEAMNFFYLVRALRLRGVMDETASVVPAFALIKGAAVNCAELWKAYTRCGDGSEDDRVCGFKHGVVNSYGVPFENHDMCVPSWQYDFTRLTETFELGRLSFEESTCTFGAERPVRVPFSKAGICHGLMIWIEYGLRVGRNDDENCFRCISTHNRSHQQIVRLLSKPVVVDEDSCDRATFECKAIFDERNGLQKHNFVFDVVFQG